MQILVDLAAQFDRKVAFVGRGMIENSEIAQRLGYLRIPAGVQIRDSDVAELPGAGRAVPGDRLAGRADVGAVAHRDRRSSPRQARRRTTRSCSRRASIPGNEKAIGRVMNHLARRGADVDPRGHQARARVGARQRGRAEADAVARAAALLRAGSRRVPPARRSTRASPARVFAGRDPQPEILLAENGDIAALRRATARASPARRRSAACSSTARAPARSATRCCAIAGTSPRTASSCRSSPSTSRPARSKACPTSSRAASSWRTARRCSPTARALLGEVIEQASVEERTDQGLIKEKLRVELRRFFRKRSGRRPFVLPVIMEI